MISLIVAKAKNGAIGKDNQLLWHLPKDLQYFKRITDGQVIIMGRKTLESLPCLLPRREHWVLTRDSDYKAPYEDVLVFHSLAAVVEAARQKEQVYIIGGAEIYQQLLPYADELLITEVDAEFEADAFFPLIDSTQFEEVHRETMETDEKHPWPFAFVVYRRKVGPKE